MDAARALPVLGGFLFMLPLLWTSSVDGPSITRVGIVYLFIIWAGLIIGAAWLARFLDSREDDRDDASTENIRTENIRTEDTST